MKYVSERRGKSDSKMAVWRHPRKPFNMMRYPMSFTSFHPQEEDRSLTYFFYSLALHAGLLTTVALAPLPQIIPEGTSPVTVSFEAVQAPLGNQIKTPHVSKKNLDLTQDKEKEIAQPPSISSQPAALPTKNVEDKQLAMVALPPPKKTKKVAYKKQKAHKIVQKTAHKIVQKKVSPKKVKTPLLDSKSQVATNLPKKKNVLPKEIPVSLDELKEMKAVSAQDLEKLKIKEAVDPVQETALEEVLSEENPPKRSKNLVAPAIANQTDPTIVGKNPNQMKQQESQIATTRKNSAPLTKGAASPSPAKPQSDMAYGVPSGTRDVKELRQYPGNIPPQYPKLSRLRKESGQVQLLYYVTQDGRVTGVRLLKSSGHEALDREALDAISKYHFFPGQQGYTTHSVVFSLEGSSQFVGGRLRTSSNN